MSTEARPGALNSALVAFLDALDRDSSLSASTLSAYRRDLERYLDFCASRDVREPGAIDAETTAAHVEHLRAAGRSAATIARSLSSLRRFHDHLRVIGVSKTDPTVGLTPPRVTRREPDPLTVEEAQRLVSAVAGEDSLTMRDRAILEVLYATGIRVSELTALRSADLLLEHALIRVHGRGARERLVPVGGAAVDAATRYARHGRPSLTAAASAVETDVEDAPFFVNAQGHGLSRMSVWKIIRGAARAAGIDRAVNPQTLRHTFAAHLLDGGFGLQDVQHLLGHADISTTAIYTRADDERLQALHRAYHPRA
ncbi:MAG: tyrosine recombinase [Candidatus Latescibacteria bacterium]|nr:tyrosine recombinase [Candidatus Latescibacterota bacterium]